MPLGPAACFPELVPSLTSAGRGYLRLHLPVEGSAPGPGPDLYRHEYRDARGQRRWHCLIWSIDTALQVIPDCKGRLYRGIKQQFDSSIYTRGHQTCWAAFSISSQSRTIAEWFSTEAQSSSGTLFFINSASAKSIAMYSQWPEEEEALFRPNTVFTITSTLRGTSNEIAQFYSKVDNIAMQEYTAHLHNSPLKKIYALGDGFTNLLVQVPKGLEKQFLVHADLMPGATLTSSETITDSHLGVSTKMVLQYDTAPPLQTPSEPVPCTQKSPPLPCHIFLPDPEPMTPPGSPCPHNREDAPSPSAIAST